MRSNGLSVAWAVSLLAVVVVGALAPGWAAAQDREARVVTKDGRSLSGTFVMQNDRVVVLSISGIETTFARDDVAELEIQPTAQELYDQVRPTLDASDLSGRLDLARRMIEMDAFELARRELSDLARAFPTEDAIAAMDTRLAAREELARQQAEAEANARLNPRPRATPRRDGRDEAERPRNAPPEASQLLSPEQINLIRVFEIDLSLEPRGLRFDPEMMQDFFAEYRRDGQPLSRAEQRRFRRLPGHEKLAQIFGHGNRSFYSGVTVTTDPPAMAYFRTRINGPYITRYFRRHFGEGQVPGLTLLGTRPTSVEEAYTNFYVLNRYVGPNAQPMIDRLNPADSLLLQWGLPRAVATSPAPEIEGWQPTFRSPEDTRFQEMVGWIESLFSNPTPPADYGLGFERGVAPAEPEPAP